MCVEAAGRGGWRGYRLKIFCCSPNASTRGAQTFLILTERYFTIAETSRKQSKNSTISVISAPSVKNMRQFPEEKCFPHKVYISQSPIHAGSCDILISCFHWLKNVL